MADLFDAATRSRIMSSIRSRDTKPELMLKKAIRGVGFSYQPKIEGSPDFINKKKKIAINVLGCFWHKCPRHYKEPKSNEEYWVPKIERNVVRDRKNARILRKKGYKVLSFWECKVLKDVGACAARIQKAIKNGN